MFLAGFTSFSFTVSDVLWQSYTQITKEEHRVDSRQEMHHHVEHQRTRASETSIETKTVAGTKQVGPPPVAPRGGGDIAQVKILGEALKLVPVKQPATFRISAPDFDRDDFQVTIAGRWIS